MVEYHVDLFGNILEISFDPDSSESIKKRNKILKSEDMPIDSHGISSIEADQLMSQTVGPIVDDEVIMINLTPYSLRVGGSIITPTGELPFLERTTFHNRVSINGVALSNTTCGNIIGLPKKKEGTMLIVTKDVAVAACRDDLTYPELKEQKDHMEVVRLISVV